MAYCMRIMHYIIKLENQIPLCVLKGVFGYMSETRYAQSFPFNHLLLDMCQEVSPFPCDILCLVIVEHERNILIYEMENELHPLRCFHTSLSKALLMQSGDESQQR